MEAQTNYQFTPSISYKGFILVVIITWLIAGTMDATAAVVILAKGNGVGVFKYIASALYGKAAFTGGTGMIFLGLFLHYTVAFLFTLFYFLVYPGTSFLHTKVIWSSIIYGTFVWIVMNLGVVPVTAIGFRPIALIPAVINLVILIICIGMPISYFASRYYAKPVNGL